MDHLDTKAQKIWKTNRFKIRKSTINKNYKANKGKLNKLLKNM